MANKLNYSQYQINKVQNPQQYIHQPCALISQQLLCNIENQSSNDDNQDKQIVKENKFSIKATLNKIKSFFNEIFEQKQEEEEAKKNDAIRRHNQRIKIGNVSKRLSVPSHIAQPEYAENGIPAQEIECNRKQSIHVHSKYEIACMRETCQLARSALQYALSIAKSGISTDEIDKKTHQFIINHGAYPSPLNYFNFPKSICTSVNEVMCHGIPDDRILKDGDIISIDVTVYKNGFHGDLCETIQIGSHDEESQKLIKYGRECLDVAIQHVGPGVPYQQIGAVIQEHIHQKIKDGLRTVDNFCGHGIGEFFHVPPLIKHFQNVNHQVMQEGHIFTIEPIVKYGTQEMVKWSDNWTYSAIDGKRSAQFEETILVTKDGFEILTAKQDEQTLKLTEIQE